MPRQSKAKKNSQQEVPKKFDIEQELIRLRSEILEMRSQIFKNPIKLAAGQHTLRAHDVLTSFSKRLDKLLVRWPDCKPAKLQLPSADFMRKMFPGAVTVSPKSKRKGA